MRKINSLTEDPSQKLSITLDDGSIFDFSLTYVPSQKNWWYSVQYGDFFVSNMRIVDSPNTLRKFQRIIPFGIAFTVIDGYEIVNQSDFVSGRVSMFVLNQQDVLEVDTLIRVGLPLAAGAFIK